MNDISRAYVAELFDAAQLDLIVDELHQTAAETIDVLGTMSSRAFPQTVEPTSPVASRRLSGSSAGRCARHEPAC